MSTLIHDLLQSFRSMRRTPAIAVTAILTLAIAIGANITVFSATNGLLLEELPFASPERLVLLWERAPQEQQLPVSLPDYFAWKERARSFENLAAYRSEGFIYGEPAGARWIDGLQVTAEIFDVLGVAPVAGRTFTPREELEGEPVAVIGEHFWKERGARPLDAEETIRLSGVEHRIIGVMPIDFRLPAAGATDVWVPLGRNPDLMRWGTHSNTFVVGRLAEGSTVESAAAEMRTIGAAIALEQPETHTGLNVEVDSIKNQLTDQYRAAMLVLSAAVFLVLLIACANVANILLVRAESRRRELAIRSALGASRGRMMRQLLADGILLSVIGAVLGIGLASWALQFLRNLDANRVIRQQIEIDGRVVLFAGAVALFAGILSGLLPAIRHFEGALIGRGGHLGRRDGSATISKAMVAAQIALALALTSAAALTIVSFTRLARVDAGFDPRGVVQAGLSLPDSEDEASSPTWLRLLERAESLPGVEAAAFSNPFPLTESRSSTGVTLEGIDSPAPNERFSVAYQTVTRDYFRVMTIPLLRGRGFSATDDGNDVVIVNEALVTRFWPGDQALGKRIRLGDRWHTIVGVAASTRTQAIHEDPEPLMYRLWTEEPVPGFTLAVRASNGSAASIVPALRTLITEVHPDFPLDDIRTADELIGQSGFRFRLLAGMLSTFSAVALMLATLGTWGITAWSVARRTREIGVRMALGADRGRIFRQLLGEGAVTAAIGIAIGIALAIPLGLALRSVLFGIDHSSPSVAFTAIAVLGATTLLAIILPVHRATRVDPSVALREE